MSEVAVTESKAATADVQEAVAMDSRNKNNKKRVPSSSPSKSLSKKSKKKQNRQRAAIEEERTLMASLFGESGIDDDAGFVRHQHPAANQSKQTATTKNKTSNAAATAATARAEEFTFEIDRMGDPSLTAPSEPLNNDDEASSRSSSDDDDVDQYDPSSGPAWVDEDDDKNDNTVNFMKGSSRLRKLRHSKAEKDVSGAQLQQRLRERFQVTTQTTARTDWAQLKHPANNNNNSDDDDDDDQQDGTVSASTRLLVAQHRGRKLVPHSLATKRCPDANQSDPNHAVVQAIDFHPSSDPDRPLLLTAGLDKSLRFFQVTEERSDKIHGIHFPKLPIYSAAFLGSTGNVLVTGRRPFFYLYDSVAGKVDLIPRVQGRPEKSWENSFVAPDGRTVAFTGHDGYVVLWDVQSRSWKANVKMNGTARAVAFAPNNNAQELLTSGSDGDVYRWDLRMHHRCVERFANQDGTITSALAVSARTLAVGAESGVVNLYSEKQQPQQQQQPTSALSLAHTTRDPWKAIMNVKTSADRLTFNSDGQILAVSSRRGKDSLKLVHVPTGTVFANWPTSKTPLGFVWSTAFSPESKFLAVGNDRGRCLLYKLMHYNNDDDDNVD